MDALSKVLLYHYQQTANIAGGLMSGLPSAQNSGVSPLDTTNLLKVAETQKVGALSQTQNQEQTSSLASSDALATISTLGRQINEFSTALGNNQDAKSGLRAFALDLSKNPSSQGLLSSLNELNTMKTQDEQNFKSVFSTAGKFAAVGGAASSFIKNVTSEPDSQTRGSIIKAVDGSLALEGSANDKRQLAEGIVSTISDIRNAAADKEAATKETKTFLDQLQTLKTIDERSAFIQTFKRNKQTLFEA